MRFSREIYEYGLPHRAVTVYMYLSNRAGRKKECFPSVKTISIDLKMSKSTVFRGLNDLESAGLVTRIARYRICGGRSSSLYKIGKDKFKICSNGKTRKISGVGNTEHQKSIL